MKGKAPGDGALQTLRETRGVHGGSHPFCLPEGAFKGKIGANETKYAPWRVDAGSVQRHKHSPHFCYFPVRTELLRLRREFLRDSDSEFQPTPSIHRQTVENVVLRRFDVAEL